MSGGPADFISGAANLDPRWHRNRRYLSPEQDVWSPVVAVVQDGGPSASGRPLGRLNFNRTSYRPQRMRKWGHPRFRLEAEVSPFCTTTTKLCPYYLWHLIKSISIVCFFQFSCVISPCGTCDQKCHACVFYLGKISWGLNKVFNITTSIPYTDKPKQYIL